MSVTIQVRRDTAANWTSANPTLHQGEIGFETDTNKAKVGDGATAWASLAYFGGSGGAGTVTTVSVATANGFAGSVANPTTTPAITVSTSVTGLLKGNGTAISAAGAADIPQLADYAPTGLTGATTASRYVGGTVSGSPGSGTFVTGDFVIDQTGKIWICTAGGSPGTWAQVSGGGGSGGTLTTYIAPKVVALSFGASIAVDASAGNVFTVTLTASTGTIANPTNPVNGELIRFRIKQDGTGSRTVAWGNAYAWGSSGGVANSAPVLTTTPSKTDNLAFEYDSVLSEWVFLGATFPQGY